MIGVSGQYLFSMSIQGIDDFIGPMDLTEFTIIEDCGNLLPTFEVSFIMGSDNPALEYLNEGNDLTIRFGRDDSHMLEGKYLINKSEKDSVIEGRRRVYLNGLFSALPYLQNAETKIYQGKSSLDVVKEICGKYFKVECEASTDDQMNWMQTGVADKIMVNNTLLHSWIPNGQSSVCLGITIDGTLRLVDLQKSMSSPKYEFGTGGITYDTEYTIEEQSTYNNSIAGYGRYKVNENVDSGMTEVSVASAAPMTGNDSPLKKDGTKPKASQASFINENIHPHYNDAEVSNRTNLMTASNVLLEFVVPGQFIPVRVLDCIKFSEYPHGNDGNTNLNISGNYLVTKVSRTIANQGMHTLIQCSRDSLSEVKGSFAPVLNSIIAIPGLFGTSLGSIGNLQSVQSQVGQVTSIFSKINSLSASVGGTVGGNPGNLISGGLGNLMGIGDMLGVGDLGGITGTITGFLSGNPTSLASIPLTPSVTSMISNFVGFDAGGLLNMSLISNLSELLQGDFSLSNIMGLGQQVLGFFGFDLGSLIGMLLDTYRIPFDEVLLQALQGLMAMSVQVPSMGGMSLMSSSDELQVFRQAVKERIAELSKASQPKNLIYERYAKKS